MSQPASTLDPLELLATLLARCPTTIEIIPGDANLWLPAGPYHPFLLVEDNLGIPQTVLYALYVHAVDVFNTARRMIASLRQAASAPADDTKPTDLLVASSSILILANSSHKTALNTRKRLVRQGMIDPLRELRFTTSLLSCQQCVKHSELWHHRRWLFSQCYRNANPEQSCDTLFCIPYASLKQEMALVSRACELYPRNYFAWMHRLICTRNLVRCNPMGFHSGELINILREEIVEAKQWVERHVSDHSATHYLISIFREALCHDNPLVHEELKRDLRHHAVSILRLYPSHETLWIYVRSVFSTSEVQELEHFVENFVQPWMQHDCEDMLLHDVSRRLLYARQFLARTTCKSDPTG